MAMAGVLCLLLRHLGNDVSTSHPNYADLLPPVNLMVKERYRGVNVVEVKVVAEYGDPRHLRCRMDTRHLNVFGGIGSGSWRRRESVQRKVQCMK
jgi:hypothetical protein